MPDVVILPVLMRARGITSEGIVNLRSADSTGQRNTRIKPFS